VQGYALGQLWTDCCLYIMPGCVSVLVKTMAHDQSLWKPIFHGLPLKKRWSQQSNKIKKLINFKVAAWKHYRDWNNFFLKEGNTQLFWAKQAQALPHEATLRPAEKLFCRIHKRVHSSDQPTCHHQNIKLRRTSISIRLGDVHKLHNSYWLVRGGLKAEKGLAGAVDKDPPIVYYIPLSP
jgi:hypothetical protein